MAETAIARGNLDTRLNRLRPAQDFSPPPRGWIKAMREALGMTTAQLARRLGVSQPNVVRIERSEAARTVTLESLDKVARVLDCTLVYALVPNRALETVVREQAMRVANRHLRASAHSMRLEDQAIRQDAGDELARRLAEELLRGRPSRLWIES